MVPFASDGTPIMAVLPQICIPKIRQPIIDAIDAAVADGTNDSYQLQQTVRRVVGRWVNRAHRRRPMIIPVVIEA